MYRLITLAGVLAGAVVIPAIAMGEGGSPAFIGSWGLADGSPDACAQHNVTTYKANEIETMESLAVYDSDSYSEVSPGHWRIDAHGVYESQRFPLTYDLYVKGDTMREVVTTEDGRQQESTLQRCTLNIAAVRMPSCSPGSTASPSSTPFRPCG